MTSQNVDETQRQAALVAGCGLLMMTLFYLFADLFIFQKLIVQGDATTTVNNIMASEALFRIGICCLLVVLVCDVVVAWALYILLKQVNKSLSLLAAWFRLVYAAELGIALLFFIVILLLISGADYLAVFEIDQTHAQVLLLIDAFYAVWALALVVFGIHLVVLGYLVFKSNYIPSIFGVLLIIAGFGYPIANLGEFLFPNFNGAFIRVTGWGELLFMFWLLYKGIKRAKVA